MSLFTRQRVSLVCLFLIGVVLGVGGMFAGRIYQVHFLHAHQPEFAPKPIDLHLLPSANSQVVTVLTADPGVSKMPLEATVAAELQSADTVLAGETIYTTATAAAALQLGSNTISTISANTILTFTSTVAESQLITLGQGQVITQLLQVEPDQPLQPVSIRTLHFLIVLQNGSLLVNTNPQTNRATVQLLSGIANVGWEDQNLNSKFQSLEVGKPVQLNDGGRSLTLLKAIPTLSPAAKLILAK